MESQSIAPMDSSVSVPSHPEGVRFEPLPQARAGDQALLVRLEIGGARYAIPLSRVAAVIEPTSMEPISDDPSGIWIGHVRSQQGAISVASGAVLLGVEGAAPRPSRIVILRAEFPVGLAVDRVLSSQMTPREAIHRLPSAAEVVDGLPVTAGIWAEDGALELVLDADWIVEELDSGFGAGRPHRGHRRLVVERYGDVDYRRALELRFDGSADRWVLPLSVVRLVTDARVPHPLPRAPEQVGGLVSWQRNPIPVVDPTYRLEIPRPVSHPARLVVIGEPIAVGGTSDTADAAVLVSGVTGMHYDLRIEHGHAWDAHGDALNLIRMLDILT